MASDGSLDEVLLEHDNNKLKRQEAKNEELINKEYKLRYILKNINVLDINKKKHICKILLTYNVNVKQHNNGVYCEISELNNDIINFIYDNISNILK